MRQKRSLWGLPFVAAALLVANACADQAEGERCDTANGDADCASGLVCTSASELGGALPVGSAICCPPTIPGAAAATVTACLARTPPLGDGGPLVETEAGADASRPHTVPDAAEAGDAKAAAHD